MIHVQIPSHSWKLSGRVGTIIICHSTGLFFGKIDFVLHLHISIYQIKIINIRTKIKQIYKRLQMSLLQRISSCLNKVFVFFKHLNRVFSFINFRMTSALVFLILFPIAIFPVTFKFFLLFCSFLVERKVGVFMCMCTQEYLRFCI